MKCYNNSAMHRNKHQIDIIFYIEGGKSGIYESRTCRDYEQTDLQHNDSTIYNESAEPSAVYHARIYTRNTHARTREIRMQYRYACCTDTQLPGKQHGLATSVRSVFGKPGSCTRPSCYFYCLHRARNGQNLVEVSHAH